MRQRLSQLHARLEEERNNHKQKGLIFRLAAFVVATALLIAGIILIFIPGPGLLLIFAALAIYSLEFHWLRGPVDRLAKKTKNPKPDADIPPATSDS